MKATAWIGYRRWVLLLVVCLPGCAGRTPRVGPKPEWLGRTTAPADALPGERTESIDAQPESFVAAASHTTPTTAPALDMPGEQWSKTLPGGEGQQLLLDLSTALSMVGGEHPAVGFAQWRVQEAYAQLRQARALWLPSINTGVTFHRHDGNIQASSGAIEDVNRSSFQYGLGAGANAAGTTPLPGVMAEFHLADAIFQPALAERTAWARAHAADGVLNLQLFIAAESYLELLRAEQEARILTDIRDRTRGLSRLTSDFAQAGQGLQADADRLTTEVALAENRLVAARERNGVASARLAEALSTDATQQIVTADVAVVPISLIPPEMDKNSLIGIGLTQRPELREAQALVAAATAAFRRQRSAAFVPSVLLGFSTGGFGGGVGSSLRNIDDRYDFDARVTWGVRNLGLGEHAFRREARALVQQAQFERLQTMDQVAREVSEAHAQVTQRAAQLDITEQAISFAASSYDRNLLRIRNGEGLPLEALQSVRALEEASLTYLQAVVDYNVAQFRLQWALGWPVAAPQI